MNSVVVHHLSLFMHVEAVHYYAQLSVTIYFVLHMVSTTDINLRTTYNELYVLSEPL